MPAAVTVVAAPGHSVSADLVGSYGDDLAILRLERVVAAASFCQTPVPITALAAGSRPQSAGSIVDLHLRDEVGALRNVELIVLSDDQQRYLRLRPKADADVISQTMSGGLIYAGDHYIGMLMEVDTVRREVLAFRANYLEDGIRSFFTSRIDLPVKIDRTMVLLDATGEELVKITQEILDLLQRGEASLVFERYGAPSLRAWMTPEFFQSYAQPRYASMTGLQVNRRLARYTTPESGGMPAGIHRWIVVLDTSAGAARFQETFGFERAGDVWKLALLSLNDAL
ncbi:MAG TPA: hypothetical protein VHQ90_18680 [Thermoanaerobaculia bacterium]|nr:hypothetical protein [Thermoanaerobaculia bacterium]